MTASATQDQIGGGPARGWWAPEGRSRRVEHFRDLVRELVLKELRVRYKRTALGYVWSIAHPLLFAGLYYFVFGTMLRVATMEDYALYLLIGLFGWQWYANSLSTCSVTFLSSAFLIRRVPFPWAVLPAANVVNDGIHFALTLPVSAVLVLVFGREPSVHWVWGVPVLVVLQLMLVTGLGLMVATVNVLLRDLERMVQLAITAQFFVTPVLFEASQVPERVRWAMWLNPMAGLVECWHGLLMRGAMPWGSLGQACAHACVWFGVGWLVFVRLRWRMAERV